MLDLLYAKEGLICEFKALAEKESRKKIKACVATMVESMSPSSLRTSAL